MISIVPGHQSIQVHIQTGTLNKRLRHHAHLVGDKSRLKACRLQCGHSFSGTGIKLFFRHVATHHGRGVGLQKTLHIFRGRNNTLRRTDAFNKRLCTLTDHSGNLSFGKFRAAVGTHHAIDRFGQHRHRVDQRAVQIKQDSLHRRLDGNLWLELEHHVKPAGSAVL